MKKGMSQKELADAIGVTQGNVSAWENGYWDPTVEKAKQAAVVLACTVDELLADPEVGDVIKAENAAVAG